MKKTLTVVTTVGTFTRTTDANYTHAVVWNSPRAAQFFQENPNPVQFGGVTGRWVKDRGYGVTWHGSEAAANNAARGGYKWDGTKATLVGVFAATEGK